MLHRHPPSLNTLLHGRRLEPSMGLDDATLRKAVYTKHLSQVNLD